jgi:short-subunit dehydrogenase
MLSKFVLKGKTLIVTGAASGLGQELAFRFLDRGANLLLIDKNLKGLEKLKNQYSEEQVEIIEFDLSNTEKIEERFGDLFKKKQDTLFGLINCAAEEHDGFFDDIPIDALQRNIQVNYWAPVILSRIVTPILKEKQEGMIVNVISDMSFRTVPGRLAYSASKAALKSFSECIRQELRPYGVDGISIFPGVMNTSFWETITTYPRMVPPPPDSRKRQTAKTAADFIMKSLDKGKIVIRQFNLLKLFLLFDAIFPIIGDKIIYKGAKIEESNL